MRLRMAKPGSEKKISLNTPPKVRFRMRILQADVIALGPGKIALLEAVKEHGSISAAARSLGMSYRRAWLLTDILNRSLNSPATVSEHGGQSGGSSVLTPVGEEIIRLYRNIETQAYAACTGQITALMRLLKRCSSAEARRRATSGISPVSKTKAGRRGRTDRR
jgi:molybdate transport system regulatory protein